MRTRCATVHWFSMVGTGKRVPCRTPLPGCVLSAAVADRAWPKDFKDRLTSPLPTTAMMWQILREGGFKGDGRQHLEAHKIPRGDGLLPTPEKGQSSITWVGHASFVIRTGGLTILTDPVWSNGLPGRSKRMTPPGIAWSDLPKVDAVVISHNHYDHQDKATLRRLPRDTPLFVPGASARWFHKLGFTIVHELDWWEGVNLRGVRFDFVPSHHWSRRGLRDACRHLWGGWVISSDSHRLYFAGDTGYGHFFKQIGERYPDIDVALMPIGAYAPRWFMKPVHTDPDEAIQATADVGAPRMATMHWGTFTLTQEPLMEPLERIREAWARTGRPREALWDLGVGESRVF